jgi:hypothetical protein
MLTCSKVENLRSREEGRQANRENKAMAMVQREGHSKR